MSLINERLEMIDSTMWANACRHVEDTEKQYLQYFDMDFEFIISVNDSDSDESESMEMRARKRNCQDLECSDGNSPDTPSASSSIPQPVRATPAQDKLKNQISFLQMELDLAIRRRDSLCVSENETRDVTKLRRETDKCTKELRKKDYQ
ncbi:unnamed protein product [Parnassius apollo]|uniref:(apollo) hypothetical protein n=1 Tax=Parnassius apollo TaxID=110799 RepID=A0A8S3WJI8_PARAO|nr:unnamed protein product [Parnassius apollo]